jgi:hypothetical protein
MNRLARHGQSADRRGDRAARRAWQPARAALGHATRATRRRAFTLLEMVLATGLFVILVGMMYGFYGSSLALRERATKTARDVQLARIVVDRICAEIHQATGFGGGYGTGIYGDKYTISINTIVIPDKSLSEKRSIQDKPLPGQFDLQEVRYYVAYDEDHPDENGYPRALGLIRRAVKTFNTDVIIEGDEKGEAESRRSFKQEMYAPEIKYVEFKYFDGAKWWDKWQITQGNALPQMVRVTVGYEPHAPQEEEALLKIDIGDEARKDPLPPDQYTRFVRLVQADTFFGSRLTREASAFAESAAEGF